MSSAGRVWRSAGSLYTRRQPMPTRTIVAGVGANYQNQVFLLGRVCASVRATSALIAIPPNCSGFIARSNQSDSHNLRQPDTPRQASPQLARVTGTPEIGLLRRPSQRTGTGLTLG